LRTFLCHTHIFAFLSCHVVCFSRGFFSRFWHSLHISSHPTIFIVSSIILLSFCAFRILEFLLGYFLEIVCMKILLCMCVGLIFVSILASFCVWTKSLKCKDAVTGIPLFRVSKSEEIQVPCQSSRRLSHPVRTPICPLFHPSGRRVIPSGC